MAIATPHLWIQENPRTSHTAARGQRRATRGAPSPASHRLTSGRYTCGGVTVTITLSGVEARPVLSVTTRVKV